MPYVYRFTVRNSDDPKGHVPGEPYLQCGSCRTPLNEHGLVIASFNYSGRVWDEAGSISPYMGNFWREGNNPYVDRMTGAICAACFKELTSNDDCELHVWRTDEQKRFVEEVL